MRDVCISFNTLACIKSQKILLLSLLILLLNFQQLQNIKQTHCFKTVKPFKAIDASNSEA